MKMRRALCSIAALALLAVSQQSANAQTSSDSISSNKTLSEGTTPKLGKMDLDLKYYRPSEHDKLRNYAFDSFGPYAFLGSGLSAGISQGETASKAQNSGIPPDWGQRWDSYGARFGSEFGINLITQTTRYSLAEAFRQDTIFYRCECTGFLPRLKHALISTVTARKGEDGHRVFSPSSTDSSIRRHGSGRFIVVSTSLRSHGRFSNGGLQPARASRPESGARIYLRRPAHIAESSSRAGAFQSDRITFRPAIEKEDANTSLLRKKKPLISLGVLAFPN